MGALSDSNGQDGGQRQGKHRSSSQSTQTPAQRRSRHSKPSRKAFVDFIFRLDVSWTFFYFIFLICVAVITTSITQTKISNTLLTSLHSVHNVRIATVKKGMDLLTERSFNMASGFLSLHSQTAFAFNSEETLAQLCSILTAYDGTIDFRSLAVTSLELKEAISCMHGDANLGSKTQLYGWMTQNSIIPGLYLINNNTYKFDRPLQSVYGGWPESVYNLTDTYIELLKGNAAFNEAAAYYNGSIKYIDYRNLWRAFKQIPHIIYCNIPASFPFRGLHLASGINVTDYVDVRVDGSTLLTTSNAASATGITAAIFINSSLTDKDPLVMSDTWGQPSVNDTEILTTYTDGQVSYLPVSNISDNLMRAALKRVQLKKLQIEGYTKTVDFQFNGAPATVTATTYTTPRGLILPMVLVSSHTDIAMPYRRIMDICNGVNAVAIVLFTACFWFFINRQLRNPLHRIATLLLLSVKRGSRALFRANRHDCVALTEVQQLGDAHNAAMRQLREIDTFIPEAVRQEILQRRDPNASVVTTSSQVSLSLRSSMRAHAKLLLTHLSTVVYITLRPPATASDLPADAVLRRGAADLPERQRLAAIVANAARAGGGANTWPFPSPAALSSFAEKLHELSDLHHGVVLRLCPDSCVLHFNKAIRAHLFVSYAASIRSASTSANEPQAEQRRRESALEKDSERSSRQDAKDALTFAFALKEWIRSFASWSVPDVRMLVDTSMFTCGHYRPLGSERTMHIAMGRDMQREVGSVPAQIGVRVAMTEETASCVRAGQRNDATGEVETGVRQIPVEALRTGRAGLDGDVVILYEALPGPVLHCEPWQRYQHCCFNAFSAMVRGDYVAALRCYKAVADISDLEPGLMPASLRREAASSDVTGGAVSVQVERLMRECVAHIMRGSTEGYRRARRSPLGIDAVLRGTTRGTVWHSTPAAQTGRSTTTAQPHDEAALAKREGRYGVEQRTAFVTRTAARYVAVLPESTLRTSYAGWAETVTDNWGTKWTLAKKLSADRGHEMHDSLYFGLSDTGNLSSLKFRLYREPPPLVSKALRDAPSGVMTDEMRSAVPMWEPSAELRASIRVLLDARVRLRHPHILTLFGYSMELEGGVITASEYCKGGNLREVMARYDHMRLPTLCRVALSLLLALRYLHSNGMVHGALRPECVLVCSDGVCRLKGFYADYALARRVLCIPRTCYVSPEVAAGQPPSPASDVFGYGLVMLELVTERLPWAWAPGAAGADGAPRTAEELAAVAAAGGQAFHNLLRHGLVVPAVENLEASEVLAAQPAEGRVSLRRCLCMNPKDRCTLEELIGIVQKIAAESGVKASALQNTSSSHDDDTSTTATQQ